MTDENASKIFEGKLTAETIITNLTAYLQQPLEPGKTLILFDEVQECPQVRTAIKFLVEDGRFDYIESGSLLGVRYKDIKSYPVGFEKIMQMYPLDFEEYLWANGIQDKTIQYLKECYEKQMEVSETVHETLCKLFYSYLVVGGMPESVQIYVDTHDIAKVISDQRSILDLYRLDIAKYASNTDKSKIKAIFDSIPSQLNEKRNLFKLYMNDVGLLCASCMENIQFDLLMGNVDVNMGSILENVFAQNLRSNGFELHYYDSKKIGKFNWKFDKSIVFSKSNIQKEENILYLPWYMIMFFKQEKMPEKMIYQIDIGDL